MHEGQPIHYANYGFQDLEREIAPNIDTSYLICSMTKAVTAAMIGQLVDEGRLAFTTPLREVLPSFQRDDAAGNITMTDLLSHRTGLPSYDGMWSGSDNRILLPRSQAIPILNYVSAAYPVRSDFLYNNMGYEVLGQVVEHITGMSYQDSLHQRIIAPLRLKRTFYAETPFDNNTAKSYAALSNGTSVEIPPWGHGKDLLIGAAGAIRSSISDLLVLYKAFIDAANADTDSPHSTTDGNPIKQAVSLLQGKIGIETDSLREHSYASGWIRLELPGVLDVFGLYHSPPLGCSGPSRLMIQHQGYIAGNVGYVAMFPETQTVVVVLANSAGLTDAMRLIGNAIVETVFDNSFNISQYVETAQVAASGIIQFSEEIHKELVAGRSVERPIRPLEAYVGRYYNAIGNYLLEITAENDTLRLSFQGSANETFTLVPYQADSFFWHLTFDEFAERARLPGYPKEYFILRFHCLSQAEWWRFGQHEDMKCITWKHEFSLPGDGEVFKKDAILPYMHSHNGL